jgi:hypothetical protein
MTITTRRCVLEVMRGSHGDAKLGRSEFYLSLERGAFQLLLWGTCAGRDVKRYGSLVRSLETRNTTDSSFQSL